MVNPMRSSPTRLMGLSSGMDTQSIVDATLRMHQFRIDNQLRNRRLIEWRQQAHNGIKDQISSLRQTFLSNLGSKSMMNRNAFNANIATAAGKNADAVTLRALAGSQTSAFSIGKITQIAQGARVSSLTQEFTGISGSKRLDSFTSGDTLSPGSLGFGDYFEAELRVGNQNVRVEQSEVTGIDWSEISATNKYTLAGSQVTLTKVNDDNYKFTSGEGENEITGTIKFVNGEAVVELEEDGLDPGKLDEFQKRAEDIGKQLTQGVDGKISRNGTVLEFTKEYTLTDEEIDGERPDIKLVQRENGDVQYNGATLDFFSERKVYVNETEITLRSNMTINQMVSAFNNSDAGVRMSFETLTGRFALETTATGEATKLDLSSPVNGNFFTKLGFTATTTYGQNAELYINGDLISTSSNTFTYGGVSITVNRTTDGAIGGENDSNAGNIAVNVSRDTTNAINRIKEFIDSYNSIIAKLEGLLSERKTGNEVSYKPLTDEEKRSMTDKQVEEWEAIAKKGIMRSDQGIQNLVSSLRSSFFSEIEGMGMSASQLGLTTGSHFDGTGGQIMVNEERLRAALEADPDRVTDIFIRIDDSGASPRGVGLLHKIDNLMRDFVNTNQSTTIRNLEESLKRTNEQIARMEQRMYAEEDKLFRQFAAMESAMSKLNQQGDWFSSMLGAR